MLGIFIFSSSFSLFFFNFWGVLCCLQVTFLLYRSLQDLAAIGNDWSENKKLKGEIQSRRFYKEKHTQEIKTLNGCLMKFPRRNPIWQETLRSFKLSMRT